MKIMLVMILVAAVLGLGLLMLPMVTDASPATTNDAGANALVGLRGLAGLVALAGVAGIAAWSWMGRRE